MVAGDKYLAFFFLASFVTAPASLVVWLVYKGPSVLGQVASQTSTNY